MHNEKSTKISFVPGLFRPLFQSACTPSFCVQTWHIEISKSSRLNEPAEGSRKAVLQLSKQGRIGSGLTPFMRLDKELKSAFSASSSVPTKRPRAAARAEHQYRFIRCLGSARHDGSMKAIRRFSSGVERGAHAPILGAVLPDALSAPRQSKPESGSKSGVIRSRCATTAPKELSNAIEMRLRTRFGRPLHGTICNEIVAKTAIPIPSSKTTSELT